MGELLKAMIWSRGAQLAARWISKGLMMASGYLGAGLVQGQSDAAGEAIGTLAIAGILALFDLISHRIQQGKSAPVPPKAAALLIVLPLLFVAGCRGRQPQPVAEGRQLTRQAYHNVVSNQAKIVEAILEVYRLEAYAHIDALVEADLAEGQRRAGPTADTAATVRFVREIEAARLAKRGEVDARIADVRQILADAQRDLVIAAKLEATLDKYDAAGVDMSAATTAIDQILELGKRLPLPALKPKTGKNTP